MGTEMKESAKAQVGKLFSGKDLRKLIIPLMIEQTLAVMVGMADTMMIASRGEAAVSGVSLVDTIAVLLIGLFGALATGGAVVAAQFLGHREPEKACWLLPMPNQHVNLSTAVSAVSSAVPELK